MWYETVYVSISILTDALGEAKEILSAEVWRSQKGYRSLLIKSQCWPGLVEVFPFYRDFSNSEKVLFSFQNEMVSRKWKFHLQINCSKIPLERIKIFCCEKSGWNSAAQPYVPSTIWDTHNTIWKVHKLWGTWHGLSECSKLGVLVFTAELPPLHSNESEAARSPAQRRTSEVARHHIAEPGAEVLKASRLLAAKAED